MLKVNNWWKLEVEQKLVEIFDSDGQSPCVIEVDYDIEKHVAHFNVGDWVHTSLLLKFHENYTLKPQIHFINRRRNI